MGGALAIAEVMPMQYKHMLGGPSLKVDMHTGAIAEGVLTFTITFIVLLIILRGPSSMLLKNWLLSMSTVAVVVAGSGYTGPSMNPANVSRTFSLCILMFGYQEKNPRFYIIFSALIILLVYMF